jgi:hypothetical protein
MSNGETSRFTPETARLAGIKSGASRRPFDERVKEADAKRMYAYLAQCADLLACQLFTPACPYCKRQGPENIRDLDSMSRSLQSIAETVLAYAWGRPSQESKSEKAGSIDDYKRALREVRKEDSEYVPDDLPSAPFETLEDAQSQIPDTP